MSNQTSEDSSVSSLGYPIGVIIPTYNRSVVLLSCLKHLERQTFKEFEVIVVDDGSTDSTPRLLDEYRRQSPLHLRCIRQENCGPARARNAAIAALRSPISLMIGDDIFVSPTCVAAHLKLHQQKRELTVAGLGLTRWSDSGQTVTKFMRWLEDSGMQFANRDLLRGVPPDHRHFYTSNISLKTALLRENPFDEAFTKAAMEDVELGYRLRERYGLELIFIPDALAHHLHPTSFRQACRRMFNVGISTHRFHEIWPSTKEISRGSSIRQALWNVMLSDTVITSSFLVLCTFFAEVLTKVWCPNLLMRYTLYYYFRLGYRRGAVRDGRPCPI